MAFDFNTIQEDSVYTDTLTKRNLLYPVLDIKQILWDRFNLRFPEYYRMSDDINKFWQCRTYEQMFNMNDIEGIDEISQTLILLSNRNWEYLTIHQICYDKLDKKYENLAKKILLFRAYNRSSMGCTYHIAVSPDYQIAWLNYSTNDEKIHSVFITTGYDIENCDYIN